MDEEHKKHVSSILSGYLGSEKKIHFDSVPLLGINNSVYKVSYEASELVFRFSNTYSVTKNNLDDEVACHNYAWKCGVAPKCIFVDKENGILVTEYISGSTISISEPKQQKNIRRIVDAIKPIHQCVNFPGFFSPFSSVRDFYNKLLKADTHLLAAVQSAIDDLKELEEVSVKYRKIASCHNDLNRGNIIDDGEKIWVIDWEYASRGDIYFDLANISKQCQFRKGERIMLLKHYFGELRPVDLAYLNVMVAVCDLRQLLWAYYMDHIESSVIDFKSYAESQLQCYIVRVDENLFKKSKKYLFDNMNN